MAVLFALAAMVVSRLSRRLCAAPAVDFIEDMRSLVVAVGLATMCGGDAAGDVLRGAADTAAETIRLAVFAAVYLTAGRIGPRSRPDPCAPLGRRRADAGHRRRQGRAHHRRAATRPSRARSQADRVPRQGAARGRGLDLAPAGTWRQLGLRAGGARTRRRPGDHHLLDRAQRRAPAHDQALRGARSGGFAGAAPVREGHRPATIDHLGGLPLLTSHPANPHGWQFAVKYALDRCWRAGV